MEGDLLKRIWTRINNNYLDRKEHASSREIKLLKYPSFSIISNNCWGGWVYRFFQLSYQSPTIGLFFLAEDYLKFVSNLREYLEKELEFIKPEDANQCERVRAYVKKFGNYPIGRLGDVDVHFLHYASQEEALLKWNRRKERIDYSRVIIKFSTQNLWEDRFAAEFDSIDFPNKLLFTNKKYECYSVRQVVFRRDKNQPETRNEGRYYPYYLNIVRYINSSKDTSGYFKDN